MLADGIEAAARTLSEPTPDRIQGLVQKMINKVFATGELDECDLTLSDLHCIARHFTRILTGIHHQRIAYEEPAEKTETARAPEAALENPAGDSKQKTQAERAGDSSQRKENLKRLGL